MGLAGVGAAVGVAGLAVSVIGMEHQAEAQANQQKYMAQVAANNKIIAEQNKEYATTKGNIQAETQGLKNAAQAGAIRAAEGSSGVDVNSGSNVEVQKGQREIGLTDAQTIRANAAREAYGYELEADSATSAGQLATAAAANAGPAGDLAAGGTLLSGAGSIGQKYAAWQQSGGGGGRSTVTTDGSVYDNSEVG